ncbi:hypothetical protein [Aquamicrobium soli]|uniref:Uncharacterized protein n=1 Tax=Aquamicrobium soli TaxID=1811518 RepID=A0ABV7KJN4_9HYPH
MVDLRALLKCDLEWRRAAGQLDADIVELCRQIARLIAQGIDRLRRLVDARRATPADIAESVLRLRAGSLYVAESLVGIATSFRQRLLKRREARLEDRQ